MQRIFSNSRGVAVAKNFYEILGVPRNASDLEIKSAYHRLARKYHPDKAPNPEEAASFEVEFSKISTAYNTLKDKDKRSAYDLTVIEASQSESSPANSVVSSSPSLTGSALGNAGSAAMEKSKATVAKRAFLKASQLMAAGDFNKAVEFLDVAIKNNENEPAYFAKMAQACLKSNRGFNRATEAAQRAIQLDPYNSDFRLILAEIYEKANIKSLAIKTYEEIIKWDPMNEKAKQAIAILNPPKKTLLSLFFKKKD